MHHLNIILIIATVPLVGDVAWFHAAILRLVQKHLVVMEVLFVFVRRTGLEFLPLALAAALMDYWKFLAAASQILMLSYRLIIIWRVRLITIKQQSFFVFDKVVRGFLTHLNGVLGSNSYLGLRTRLMLFLFHFHGTLIVGLLTLHVISLIQIPFHLLVRKRV